MNGINRKSRRAPVFAFLSLAVAWLPTAAMPLFAAVETDLSKGGISLSVAASPDTVDVARDFEVVVKAVAPAGTAVEIPDLRDRFRGFSVAEDFSEEPVTDADGSTSYVSSWRLVPRPCEKTYKLLPFAVTLVRKSEGAEERDSFCTSPVYFRNPAVRETVTGGIEVEPEKDLPPFSWKMVRYCALLLLAACAAGACIWWTAKKIAQKIREHRMSPIERAMLELDRLLQKGLPGRGRYKDFYVELTMVVRRYARHLRAYGGQAQGKDFGRGEGALPAYRAHLQSQLLLLLCQPRQISR